MSYSSSSFRLKSIYVCIYPPDAKETTFILQGSSSSWSTLPHSDSIRNQDRKHPGRMMKSLISIIMKGKGIRRTQGAPLFRFKDA